MPCRAPNASNGPRSRNAANHRRAFLLHPPGAATAIAVAAPEAVREAVWPIQEAASARPKPRRVIRANRARRRRLAVPADQKVNRKAAAAVAAPSAVARESCQFKVQSAKLEEVLEL
jgi:hypothetical protein